MKRQAFKATLSVGGTEISESIAYAHNSGIRASEALARAYACERGVILHGDRPHRDETGYTRAWRAEGIEAVAKVVKS